MFRALLCPSSGARQTGVSASGFRMNVQVDVFLHVLLNQMAAIVLYSFCLMFFVYLLFV
jgi:hypothetical protein